MWGVRVSVVTFYGFVSVFGVTFYGSYAQECVSLMLMFEGLLRSGAHGVSNIRDRSHCGAVTLQAGDPVCCGARRISDPGGLLPLGEYWPRRSMIP